MKFRYIFTFLLLISFSDTAVANNKQDIIDFVNNNTKRIVAVLEAKLDKNTKKEKLRALFYDIVDYEWMSKFVVAKNWCNMTKDQQQKYLKIYQRYLSNLYVKKFVEYHNQSSKIVDVSDIGNGHFIIATEIISNQVSRPVFSVSYRVKRTNNSLKVIDVIGEGISLLSTQRADFASIIDQKGLSSFIEMLEQKIQ